VAQKSLAAPRNVIENSLNQSDNDHVLLSGGARFWKAGTWVPVHMRNRLMLTNATLFPLQLIPDGGRLMSRAKWTEVWFSLIGRKARFLEAALSGDRTIRPLEEEGGQANQFAMAKAIASGNSRLMRRSGLESEIARLRRLQAAHMDDQHAIRLQIRDARHGQTRAEARIAAMRSSWRSKDGRSPSTESLAPLC
jgi:hypothetical protein